MSPIQEDRWEVLELIGAYAAGELEGDETREAERLIFERPDYRRLAESYARMLVMLTNLAEEPIAAPEAVIPHAVRRAYVSTFPRQAETLLGGIGRSYLDAFVYYFGSRAARPAGSEGYGGGM